MLHLNLKHGMNLRNGQVNNRKVWIRISELIDEARRTPFEGKGKPEFIEANYPKS